MLKLTASKRANEKMKALMDDNFIPAVAYGNLEFIKEPISIKFKKLDFERILVKAGQHSLIDLSLDNSKEPLKVIIKDVQRDFVKGSVSHVDLYCVNMKEKIVTEVPIDFIGDSLAVKNLGGILVRHSDTVKIKCLPENLMSKIDIDISDLKTLEDSLHFRDLKISSNVELITDKNRVIVNIARVKKVEKKKEEVVDKTKVKKGEEEKNGDVKK